MSLHLVKYIVSIWRKRKREREKRKKRKKDIDRSREQDATRMIMPKSRWQFGLSLKKSLFS